MGLVAAKTSPVMFGFPQAPERRSYGSLHKGSLAEPVAPVTLGALQATLRGFVGAPQSRPWGICTGEKHNQ